MDISAIAAHNDLRTFMADQNRHETELAQFQSILEQAMANSVAIDRAAIRHAAEEFESFFLQKMFRAMRSTTLNENSFVPMSSAETIFTEMLDEEVSRSAAAAGGIGLADMIYRQMTKNF
jgi:flagellar protein FlgJ